MKVEIWSDVMCPFCYIGKRRFEKALNSFSHKANVEVVWKSFQLNPAMKTDPEKNINQYLAEVKGWSVDQAKEMNARVTDMAKEVGLNYDFDKAVVANSLKAHQVIQLAKGEGKGDDMEEALFDAYFTKGLNIDDEGTLVQLASAVGLEEASVRAAVHSQEYVEKVEEDVYEARQIGVSGVPYFVFNDKYAVSGAQATETFAGALEKAFGEWEKQYKN
jgi:predicted DsbA family dithiol-disulfide isomerase